MSGGLALFWKEKIVVTIGSSSRFHIDAIISGKYILPLGFSGFCGNLLPKEDILGNFYIGYALCIKGLGVRIDAM